MKQNLQYLCLHIDNDDVITPNYENSGGPVLRLIWSGKTESDGAVITFCKHCSCQVPQKVTFDFSRNQCLSIFD